MDARRRLNVAYGPLVRTTRKRGHGGIAIVLALGCVLSLVVLTSAYASNAGGARQSSFTDQTWLVTAPWAGMDPTKISATAKGAVLLALEPAVLIDPDGHVVPNVTDLKSPNLLVRILKVRKGVKFWDGAPLTAHDVAYSLGLHLGAGSASLLARGYQNVRWIRWSGDTVRILLKQPDVLFNGVLGQSGIVERAVRVKLGTSAGAPDALNVGTGPFRIAKYVPGDRIELVRNDAYWGKKSPIQTLTFRYISDSAASLLAVRSGQVTGSFGIPAADFNVYSSLSGMHVVRGPNPQVTMLSINTTRPPWNDVHVRRAVAYAVDKATIVDALLHGTGAVASTLPSPSSMQRVLPAKAQEALYAQLDKYHYNLQAAKQELARSSVPNGFQDAITVQTADQARIAQVVSQALAGIGITLNVSQVPGAAYGDAVFFKHTASIAVVQFATDNLDPVTLPLYLTSSRNIIANGGYLNLAEYKNAKLDALLGEARALPLNKVALRAKDITSALKIIADQVPYVPIYNADYLGVMQNGISYPGFSGFWWLTRWIDALKAG
jgi:peptide/nickel transport system substrate-binding protein